MRLHTTFPTLSGTSDGISCVTNMDKLVKDLNVKIELLKFTRDKTGTIKDGAVITAMERHLKSLNTVLDDLDALRRDVEQSKFEKGEEPEAVAEWGKELDGEIEKTDEAITTLKNAIAEVRSNQIVIDREKEHAQSMYSLRDLG